MNREKRTAPYAEAAGAPNAGAWPKLEPNAVEPYIALCFCSYECENNLQNAIDMDVKFQVMTNFNSI